MVVTYRRQMKHLWSLKRIIISHRSHNIYNFKKESRYIKFGKRLLLKCLYSESTKFLIHREVSNINIFL